MWIAIQNAVGARQGVGGGPTPPPYTPPLDGATDILAAYSVRKLLSTYSGPCMEVHRVSDGAKQDIYFDSDGLVNTADIIAFASGSDLEVSTWYDQGPLSNHAIIDTSAVDGQPFIYYSGGLETINGVPAILGGSNRSWVLTSDITTAHSIFDVRFTGTVVSISNNFLYGNSSSFDYHSGTNGTDNIYLNPTFSAAYVQGGNNYELGVLRDFTTYAYPSRYVILSMLHTSASGRINQLSRDRTQTGRSWTTNWQESIIFGADKTSSRTTLESNFNSYYQITNLPDYTSGLLADYSGAEAAYSVRQLNNTAIKAMRVRQTVAPFDELDIGFDSNGDLDEAAIVAFGAGNPLTISRWYDQSGFSRHAVQATSGSQPTIYNGTSVVTKNGKPALAFGGATNFIAQIDVINQPSTYVAVHDIVTTSGYTYPWSAGNLGQEFTSYGLTQSIAIAGSYLIGPNIDDYMVSSVVFNGASSIIRTNGTVGVTGNAGTNSTGTSLGIGARFNGSTSHLASGSTMQELIVWPTNQTSPTNNLPAIETNLNDYYYAYNTSGFVVDYPGAIAAYSVRQLGNRQRYAMQVTRLAGSNDTLDIGFDSNGDLDTQAIIDFGGSDSVGVSIWYNQAGSRNATNTNTANMPNIYDGSSIITDDNGVAALGRNSSGQTLTLSGNIVPAGTPQCSFIAVMKGDGNDNPGWRGSGGLSLHSLNSTNNIAVYNGSTPVSSSLPATTDPVLAVQVTGGPSNEKGWRNGVSGYDAFSGSGDARTNTLGLATATGGPVLMQEMILYPGDIDAGGTRTNIETNIMTYYSIP